MKISFILTLKNRIDLTYTANGETRHLYLLGNNLKSLCAIIPPEDNWEFVVVDFASTDANVDEFLKATLSKSNMSYKLIRLEEPFNKGKGFNIAIKYCSHEIIFCLDADMIIHTYDLFRDIKTLVEDQGKVLFPICWSYHNPGHTSGWKRDSGTGNVICKKSEFNAYIEKTTWGQEDDRNYAYFQKKGIAARTYYDDKFVHQWHPKVWF